MTQTFQISLIIVAFFGLSASVSHAQSADTPVPADISAPEAHDSDGPVAEAACNGQLVQLVPSRPSSLVTGPVASYTLLDLVAPATRVDVQRISSGVPVKYDELTLNARQGGHGSIGFPTEARFELDNAASGALANICVVPE